MKSKTARSLIGPNVPTDRKLRAEQVGVDRGADEPDHRPAARVGEAVEIEPLIAVLPDRDRALALGRPSSAARSIRSPQGREPEAREGRRRIGFRPTRCSSNAQISTGRSGFSARRSPTRLASPSHGVNVVKHLRNCHLGSPCLFWIQSSSPLSPCGQGDRITSHPVGCRTPAP
jgi:hypothetical protein